MMLRVLLVTILVGAVIDAAPKWRVLSGEYKSFRQKGDQINAVYEKLDKDGSITRRVACGDIRKGLNYDNYKVDKKGNIRQLERPGVYPPPVGLLKSTVYSGYPRDSGVARLKPEKPQLTGVKLSRGKNPLKNFFQDIFSE